MRCASQINHSPLFLHSQLCSSILNVINIPSIRRGLEGLFGDWLG